MSKSLNRRLNELESVTGGNAMSDKEYEMLKRAVFFDLLRVETPEGEMLNEVENPELLERFGKEAERRNDTFFNAEIK